MALAGSMAGGIAGFLGNPAELIMVRMQADKAKPEGREFPFFSICLSIQLESGREGLYQNDSIIETLFKVQLE